MAFSPAKILVPIDGTPSSMAAFEAATDIARKWGSKIDVIHIWEPWVYEGTERVMVHAHDDERPVALPEFMGQQAQIVLETFLKKEHADGLDVRGEVVPGTRAKTIIERSVGYDLIVLGSHEHSAIAGMLFGSVTDRVVRGAKCPVLVIHVAEGGLADK